MGFDRGDSSLRKVYLFIYTSFIEEFFRDEKGLLFLFWGMLTRPTQIRINKIIKLEMV